MSKPFAQLSGVAFIMTPSPSKYLHAGNSLPCSPFQHKKYKTQNNNNKKTCTCHFYTDYPMC